MVDVLTAGYEAPGFTDVEATFPAFSALTAGERGLEAKSVDTDGARPGGTLIALTREGALTWPSMYGYRRGRNSTYAAGSGLGSSFRSVMMSMSCLNISQLASA